MPDGRQSQAARLGEEKNLLLGSKSKVGFGYEKLTFY
jgi:hypothetical protein